MQSSRDVVLITGGARRIGRAIAQQLDQMGYRIVLHARAWKDAEAQAARDEGFLLVEGDLLEETPQEIWDKIPVQLHDRIVGVVHNASEYREGRKEDATEDDLAQMMRLHDATGVGWSRILQGRPGALVVHMLDARIGGADPKHWAYLESKKRLAARIPTLAKEMAPARCMGVAPGVTDAFTLGVDEVRAIAQTYTGALVGVDEVARVVAQLFELPSVTGQTWFVDGGRHLRDAGPNT